MADILYRDLSYSIVGAAMEVHRVLGPGFLEAVYQSALAHELKSRGIRFEELKRIPVTCKGVPVGNYEADFVVEDSVILEIKAVSGLHPAHEAQAINYLTATGLRLVILLNFGTKSLEFERLVR